MSVSKVDGFKLPKWTKNLPNDTRLNSRDLAQVLDYKDVESFNNALHRGVLFRPDSCNYYKNGKVKANFWSMGYLRKMERLNRG